MLCTFSVFIYFPSVVFMKPNSIQMKTMQCTKIVSIACISSVWRPEEKITLDKQELQNEHVAGRIWYFIRHVFSLSLSINAFKDGLKCLFPGFNMEMCDSSTQFILYYIVYIIILEDIAIWSVYHQYTPVV